MINYEEQNHGQTIGRIIGKLIDVGVFAIMVYGMVCVFEFISPDWFYAVIFVLCCKMLVSFLVLVLFFFVYKWKSICNHLRKPYDYVMSKSKPKTVKRKENLPSKQCPTILEPLAATENTTQKLMLEKTKDVNIGR